MSEAGAHREIERKFLVRGEAWKAQAFDRRLFAQGYLNDVNCPGSRSSIRVRIEGDRARLNVKSLEIGISRDEYEYPVPVEEARRMMDTLAIGPVVEKVRYWVRYDGFVWEVDEFLGDNAGLVVAEVELPDERVMPSLPDWVGPEVTDLLRYYNVSLAQRPYKEWTDEEKRWGVVE